MMASAETSARSRARVSKICLAFPEATRDQMGDHSSFRVRGKVFAYFLDNHHGDGIVSVCCKLPPGDNADLVRLDPRRFYLPAYIGPRGWVGLRLDLGTIDWEEVETFLLESYRLVAPKRLVATLTLRGH